MISSSLVPGMGRGGGFHRYATRLVQGLFELEDDHQYILFVNRLGGDFFPSGKRFTKVVVPLPPHRRVWPFRILWQQVLLPTYIRRLRLDTIHFPFDTATFFPGGLPCFRRRCGSGLLPLEGTALMAGCRGALNRNRRHQASPRGRSGLRRNGLPWCPFDLPAGVASGSREVEPVPPVRPEVR